jgi:rhamnogalacturonan endolyase
VDAIKIGSLLKENSVMKSVMVKGLATMMAMTLLLVGGLGAQRQMENLGRGVVAINQNDGNVYVGWRMLGTDPDDVAFNLYRSTGDREPVKLNHEAITESTNFVDEGVDLSQSNSYFVRPVLDSEEQEASNPFTLPANPPARQYISVPLQTPEGYRPNDAAVGDLDGDGEYDIVLKQEMRGRDNARRGVCEGTTKLEGYKIDGTFLWRIDLGRNIREGAHYTPFTVYDLDGDGIAEIAVRTSEETVDGTGAVIGDTDGDGICTINRPSHTSLLKTLTNYMLAGTFYSTTSYRNFGKELRL